MSREKQSSVLNDDAVAWIAGIMAELLAKQYDAEVTVTRSLDGEGASA